MNTVTAQLLHESQLLYAQERDDEALALLRQALELEPASRECHVQLAYVFFRTGRVYEAAQELVWLWAPQFGPQGGLLAPGVDLSGKTILLSADAGLGDSIMFARFALMLRHRGCRVVLQVQEPLVRLFQLSDLADVVVSRSEDVPPHDLRLPFHNLMAAVGVGHALPLMGSAGYLTPSAADVAHFASQLPPPRSRRTVGICWQGNPNFPNDKLRSVSLDAILRFTDANDHVVSLVPTNTPIEGTSMAIQSFAFQDIAETAALIQCLDYVITVDTMVCHLSGALGVPTLLLNRFNGCWRWGKDQQRSIWYDAIDIKRLVRS